MEGERATLKVNRSIMLDFLLKNEAFFQEELDGRPHPDTMFPPPFPTQLVQEDITFDFEDTATEAQACIDHYKIFFGPEINMLLLHQDYNEDHCISETQMRSMRLDMNEALRQGNQRFYQCLIGLKAEHTVSYASSHHESMFLWRNYDSPQWLSNLFPLMWDEGVQDRVAELFYRSNAKRRTACLIFIVQYYENHTDIHPSLYPTVCATSKFLGDPYQTVRALTQHYLLHYPECEEEDAAEQARNLIQDSLMKIPNFYFVYDYNGLPYRYTPEEDGGFLAMISQLTSS